ncbi:hydroxylamine reductase [Anaerohalosphaera lusitana]
MFCYQCEQTAKGSGCTAHGVCGKGPEVASLQDLTVHALKEISRYAHAARQLGVTDDETNVFTIKACFSTLTNVNFDAVDFQRLLQKATEIRQKIGNLYEDACRKQGKQPEDLNLHIDWWKSVNDLNALVDLGESVTIENRLKEYGDDVTGLQELIVYGLKGLSAYADHAQILGQQDDAVYAFVHEAFDYVSREPQDVEQLTAMALKTGAINLRAMELLDAGNTKTYGNPEPTQCRVTPVKGKAIVVSGHDLKDLHELLKQTEGKGINVYTHGEMLPCNAYPELKKFDHLVGNYGGAWQDQRKEFDEFPGAILMTTNCLQKPKDSYKDRIFTSGLVGWPDVQHIDDYDFTPVIEAALAQPGFTEDAPEKRIPIGFAHNTVMSVAENVVDLVKAGKIKHFFLIGGCDGAKPGRNYYTEFAEKVPDDCVILTLACGKYRFNKMEFGDIEGIPRILDCGQCNDAYSAIQIAVALSKAFDCGVNDLPLSMILSWYEQKAVAILLTLLHLGIKDMKLGPSLPAFVGPNVLNVLVEQFGLAPVATVEDDLAECLS